MVEGLRMSPGIHTRSLSNYFSYQPSYLYIYLTSILLYILSLSLACAINWGGGGV